MREGLAVNVPAAEEVAKMVSVGLNAKGGNIDRPQLEICSPDGNLRKLEEIEADVITFAISHYEGHMSEVARRLRVSRSTLYRKVDAIQS